MTHASIIGIDLAKRVFQLHGADSSGAVVFRRKLSRSQLLGFLQTQPLCVVAMEACASAHFWGREIAKLGHEVKLIAPIYVKPFVKRHKNDAADAEAISEAASRPTMRFVALKSPQQQARSMLFRTRSLLVRQRSQTISALRAHLAEFGYVAACGVANVKRLEALLADPDTDLLPDVRALGQVYLELIAALSARLAVLDKQQRTLCRQDDMARRLQTMPGIGPVTALAVETFAPPMEMFRCGRDFAAWLGLVPRQHSTGGKAVLGKTSKMGQRDIRRLLIIGAMSRIRWAGHNGKVGDPWLGQMLRRKPPMLVAIALANKMARQIWAMLTHNQDYRPALIGAS